MASMDELREVRIQKVDELRKRGINPYPAKPQRTNTIAEVVEQFSSLVQEESVLFLVGRIRGMRIHGGSTFLDLEDGTGQIQIFFGEDEVGKETYTILSSLTDLGDFIEVSGTLFTTKQDAHTLKAQTLKILTKALRPIPDSYFGLKDTEERLRKRYLDLAVNSDTRDLFTKKAAFWRSVRTFMEGHGFLEVDTPTLEDVPGGADATPFTTHHNALDKNFYLRISLELPLKKILIGGFEKVYEIGKVFRNEGISSEHLQDYLMCEFYWAYADYNDMMGLVQGLYRHISEETTGELTTNYEGKEINWAGKWDRADFVSTIKKETGLDVVVQDKKELEKWAQENNLRIDTSWGKGKLIDYIWKKKVRPNIIGPMFITDHPTEVSPLAKEMSEKEGHVQRLQVIAAGTELGNGWSELNDPQEQRRRFEEQQKLREEGDTEAHMKDESYLEALEYGMPPAAGFGFSERLFAVLMDESVRETVIFPPMRKEDDND